MPNQNLRWVQLRWDKLQTVPLDRDFIKDETTVDQHGLRNMKFRGLVRVVRVVYHKQKGRELRVWRATDEFIRCAKILNVESGGDAYTRATV
jgi:hypothetical protein